MRTYRTIVAKQIHKASFWISGRGGLPSVFMPLMLLSLGPVHAEAFFPWKTDLSPTDGWQFVVSDFDADGKSDLLGYHPLNGSIWFGKNAGGRFEFARWSDMVGGDPRGWRLVASAHFDSNDRPDALFYHLNTGRLLIHFDIGAETSRVGPRMFLSFPRSRPGNNLPPVGWHWQFDTGDFDADGRIDVVGYDAYEGKLHLGRNTGDRFEFSEHSRELSPRSGWQFAAGDFDMDGRVDVLGYRPMDGSLHLGVDDGTRFVFTELRTFLGRRSRFVAGNIHHRSGNSDIIRYDVGSGELSRGVNQVDVLGGFAYSGPWAQVPDRLRSRWQLLAGDFFGDSRTDVLLYDSNQGTLWVGSDHQEFEGYAWPLSVEPCRRDAEPCQPIDFYVSGIGSAHVEFFRHTSLGQDVRSERMEGPAVHFVPKVQFTASRPWRNGAGWVRSFSFTIPEHWPSGIYSARLSSSGGSGTRFSDITFVVKPPARRSTVAVLANVNTWLAYNKWGGGEVLRCREGQLSQTQPACCAGRRREPPSRCIRSTGIAGTDGGHDESSASDPRRALDPRIPRVDWLPCTRTRTSTRA